MGTFVHLAGPHTARAGTTRWGYPRLALPRPDHLTGRTVVAWLALGSLVGPGVAALMSALL